MSSSINTQSKSPILPEGLYGIITEALCFNHDVIETAQQLLQGGVRVIQYREKTTHKTSAQRFKECLALRGLTRDYNALLIINDDPALAVMCEADGVHLGQDDFPLHQVRQLIKPNQLIGISTHSLPQAEKAWQDGADYIGFGPLFATQTKPDYEPIGLSLLPQVVQRSPVPVVAIGGIKLHNLPQILTTGVRHVCLVSEIIGDANPLDVIQTLQKILDREWLNHPTPSPHFT
jgi:thiamine-phosphate pyrophosphorylase